MWRIRTTTQMQTAILFTSPPISNKNTNVQKDKINQLGSVQHFLVSFFFLWVFFFFQMANSPDLTRRQQKQRVNKSEERATPAPSPDEFRQKAQNHPLPPAISCVYLSVGFHLSFFLPVFPIFIIIMGFFPFFFSSIH